MSKVTVVRFDDKYEGPQKFCLACGGRDLRVTYPLGSAFVWCVDCIRGWHVGSDRPFDVAGMDDFLEQSVTLRAIRRQDLQQLQDEHDQYKSTLDTLKGMILSCNFSNDSLLEEICDALGLDYNEEVEKYNEA